MKTVLTIAGSDSSGGAGIQADIKTITMNGVYAMSVITVLTAQNTTGVFDISETLPDFLKLQLDAVFNDIFPDSVKIGMVSSESLIKIIADSLKIFKAKNIVLDPVMVSTSGARLINSDAISALTKEIFPTASIITPNIPEAEILSGFTIKNENDMEKTAKYIGEKYSCAVLLKGGHNINTANDVLFDSDGLHWFFGRKIDNPNTHGTGCTLSSAVAANLAKGFSMSDSVKRAKNYITDALNMRLNLGKGSGPLMHNFDLKSKYAEENES